MNERIRELIEQAHEQKPVIVLDPETCQPTHKIGNGGVPMYHSELNPEKFAELIVRQCAKVIDAQKPVWQNTDVPAEIALDMAAKNIKAYFGVKE